MAKKSAKKKVAVVKKAVIKKKSPLKKREKKQRDQNTVIIVKYNCGFDNHLTIRGEGAGLSWFKGVALKNISADEWVFDLNMSDPHLEFKILINDQVFEVGENHKVKNGHRIDVYPSFH